MPNAISKRRISFGILAWAVPQSQYDVGKLEVGFGVLVGFVLLSLPSKYQQVFLPPSYHVFSIHTRNCNAAIAIRLGIRKV